MARSRSYHIYHFFLLLYKEQSFQESRAKFFIRQSEVEGESALNEKLSISIVLTSVQKIL